MTSTPSTTPSELAGSFHTLKSISAVSAKAAAAAGLRRCAGVPLSQRHTGCLRSWGKGRRSREVKALQAHEPYERCNRASRGREIEWQGHETRIHGGNDAREGASG